MAEGRSLELGELHETTALRLNDDGDGVATIDGMTVFIPFLLPGERARVRVTEREKRFARGVIEERYDASPDRQDAPCPVFGECGGCQVQHMTYDAQLAWKEGRIRHIASTLGEDVETFVKPIVPSLRPFRYRNQVQIPVRFNDTEERVEMGFYGPASHDMVPTDSCHLQSEAMQATLDKARRFLTSLGGDMAKLVHHVIVRESEADGEQLVVFAVVKDDEDIRRTFSRFHANRVKTVALTAQPRIGGPVWGRKVEVLKGIGALTEELIGARFRVSPRSFLQVQTDIANRLYETVVEYAEIGEDDTVVDAYCGIGTMTLLLAGVAKRVVGIEEISAAVEDAKVNAKANRVDNVKFHTGRVETWLPQWMASGARPDVIVFDPPRKGIDKAALQATVEAKIPRVVYASCNPSTMKRDLQAFLENGYEIRAMQPMDMFPQTSHVETVVKLVRG